MKKRWYDYLWIVELTYMALGFSISCLPGWAWSSFAFR